MNERYGHQQAGEMKAGVDTARFLLLLSQQQQRGGRLFECKTCGRLFPTFQALGGHRASHRRPGPYGAGQLPGRRTLAAHEGECAARPRVHACPVCGVEFAVGQALGGHMRRHRAAATVAEARRSGAVTSEACHSVSTTSAEADDNGGDCAGGICLELNLTPSASCAKCQKKAKAAGLPTPAQGVQETLILDCIL